MKPVAVEMLRSVVRMLGLPAPDIEAIADLARWVLELEGPRKTDGVVLPTGAPRSSTVRSRERRANLKMQRDATPMQRHATEMQRDATPVAVASLSGSPSPQTLKRQAILGSEREYARTDATPETKMQRDATLHATETQRPVAPLPLQPLTSSSEEKTEPRRRAAKDVEMASRARAETERLAALGGSWAANGGKP